MTRYYEQDTWKENLIFEESSFDLLQDILADAGELEDRVPYESLVTTDFAEKARGGLQIAVASRDASLMQKFKFAFC